MRLRGWVGLALVGALAGCAGSSSPSVQAVAPSASKTVPSPVGASPAAAGPTVWLCRPGMDHNPCEGGLDATVVSPAGTRTHELFRPTAKPKIDCFYVYPTVSAAKADNAPRTVAPELVSTARAQAARFASSCRLFVPVYRQVTTQALLTGRYFNPAAQALAQRDVVAAWHDYLAHDNAGRGVVLIGHSQGAMALIKLIRSDIDDNPLVRRHIVSALLLGGQATTAAGKDIGGDFAHLPACRRAGQTGCVIAYSMFASQPPANAFFGHAPAGRDVLCTDPSVLAGRPGRLHPYLPANVVPGATTHADFLAYPESLSVACKHVGNSTWLQVGRAPGSRISSQQQPLGPQWGLHIGDVNLALGDLLRAVALEAAAWH